MASSPWNVGLGVSKHLLVGVACAGALFLGVLLERYGDLNHLDDEPLAKRLLESRGIGCTPKIVDRREGELRIACADGTYTFVISLPCGSPRPWLCDVLGFDAACWEQTF